MASKQELFRKFYKAHVYAGLFVLLHLIVFSVSGLLLLFKDEIQGGASTSAVVVEHGDLPRGYAAVLSEALRLYPGDRPLAFYPDDQDASVLNVRLGRDGATKLRGARKAIFGLESGRELAAPPAPASGFFDWTLRLHRELLMGSNGKLYVGLVGLVYAFMLFSGFLIYGNFMKGRSWREIRAARVPRLVDWHKFIGMVTFGWALVVALSGVFLAFNGVLIKLFQARSLAELSRQYEGSAPAAIDPASLAQVVGTALAAKPGWAPTYLSFPDTEYGIPGHYLFLVNGSDPFTERLSELVVVNAQNGVLARTMELPLYLKLVLLSEPLHFGDYGGWPLKVLWALFTLASLAVALLGAAAWWVRRRKRVEVSVTKPRGPRESPRARGASPYPVPILLALLTGLGLVAALFATGPFAAIAVALVALPLFAFLRVRRRHA